MHKLVLYEVGTEKKQSLTFLDKYPYSAVSSPLYHSEHFTLLVAMIIPTPI